MLDFIKQILAICKVIQINFASNILYLQEFNIYAKI